MRQILTIALAVISYSLTAQTLNIEPLEAEAGTQAELVVNANGIAAMTALQFNLELPDGVTFANNEATLGEATKDHKLIIETLAGGDRLFILYSMDLNTFKAGELIRIPVCINIEAAEGIARLHKIRFADTNARSYAAVETESFVTEIKGVQEVQNVQAVQKNIYNLAGQRLGKPQKGINIQNGRKVVVN